MAHSFPNTFSCDPTVDDIQFIIRLSDAPLSVNAISKNTASQLFDIYPNPANDELIVNTDINYNYSIGIMDLAGRQLLIKDTVGGKNRINVSNFNNGCYLLQLITNDLKTYKKFIISH